MFGMVHVDVIILVTNYVHIHIECYIHTARDR